MFRWVRLTITRSHALRLPRPSYIESLLGFVDSRVERVALKDLWMQRWHHGFVPNPEVTMP